MKCWARKTFLTQPNPDTWPKWFPTESAGLPLAIPLIHKFNLRLVQTWPNFLLSAVTTIKDKAEADFADTPVDKADKEEDMVVMQTSTRADAEAQPLTPLHHSHWQLLNDQTKQTDH